MQKPISKLIINLGLLFSALASAFSGLLIQFNYHMGNNGGVDINDTAFGINYFGWSNIHKISIIFFSIFMIFHIILRWKWYKAVFIKKLIAKNRQVIILSLVFVLVAISGYIPWFIGIMRGDELLRKAIIEIHDKLALILSVFLVLHIIKKLKWFITIFGNINNKQG